MLNDFYFQIFILIIKKNDERFVIIIITKCNKIINVEMNQI